MKTFIRNREGLYFRADGNWTDSREAAKDFRTSALAIWESRISNLKSVEIVLVSDAGPAAEEVLVFPLHDPHF
jgi:hypothetical protein